MSLEANGVARKSMGAKLARAGRWVGRERVFATGAVIVGLVTICTLLAPIIAPMDPLDQDLAHRLQPPSWPRTGEGPYILGSDGFGRDILSWILYGGRISMAVAASSIAVSGSCGILLGLIAGYYEGRLGTVIMRLVDMQMALPPILLAVTVIAIFGNSLSNLIIVLAISSWFTYTRVLYGQVRSLKQMQYVLAAIALGASNIRIILRHILPNSIGVIVVMATLQVGRLILFEAGLSFLGMGVPPPTPSWGSMLAEGRNVLAVASWLAAFPGLAVVFTVLGINFLGNGLREVLDPRLRGRVTA